MIFGEGSVTLTAHETYDFGKTGLKTEWEGGWLLMMMACVFPWYWVQFDFICVQPVCRRRFWSVVQYPESWTSPPRKSWRNSAWNRKCSSRGGVWRVRMATVNFVYFFKGGGEEEETVAVTSLRPSLHLAKGCARDDPPPTMATIWNEKDR